LGIGLLSNFFTGWLARKVSLSLLLGIAMTIFAGSLVTLPLHTPMQAYLQAVVQAVCAHRLGEPFGKRLPILDASVDRVSLQGTFNEKPSAEEQLRRLQEVRRVMKSGGELHLHLLTSDKPFFAPNQPACTGRVRTARDQVISRKASGGGYLEKHSD
jgi:hypothetical protein